MNKRKQHSLRKEKKESEDIKAIRSAMIKAVRTTLRNAGVSEQKTATKLSLQETLALFDGKPKAYALSPDGRLCIVFKGGTPTQLRELVEMLLADVLSGVRKGCPAQLKRLGVEATVPLRPFKVFNAKALEHYYVDEYEKTFSRTETKPFWVSSDEGATLVYSNGCGKGGAITANRVPLEKMLRRLSEKKREQIGPYLLDVCKNNAEASLDLNAMLAFVTGKPSSRKAY